MANSDFQTNLPCFELNLERQFGKVIDFFELIQNPIFAWLRRIRERQHKALHGVPKWKESAALVALAVEGQRMPDDRLTTEAVDRGAECLVEIESSPKTVIFRHLIEMRPEHH